jgi:hypothetical protein
LASFRKTHLARALWAVLLKKIMLLGSFRQKNSRSFSANSARRTLSCLREECGDCPSELGDGGLALALIEFKAGTSLPGLSQVEKIFLPIGCSTY